ncbi:energy transducer TonB family protein [Sulfurimonas sp. CS5]|uniref:energy transducer TonB family protein n=1 Tax=Sulfurimonas sp. CS5 TaxID=3391145 RepID=UPI0039EC1D3F
MIRHSSSFLFSLVFHGVLLLILLFTWENLPSTYKVDSKDKICVQLCDVIVEKPVVKPLKKPQPKPEEKPKPIVKKIEIVKEVTVEVPEVKEETIVEEKYCEDIEVVQKEIIKEDIYVENPATKQARLEQEYIQENIAKIVKLLQDNLYYPRRARKRGISGEVIVKFTLSKNAVVHSIEVISSKSEILSRAAVKTIEDLSGKFPIPSEELILHVPINYSLNM